LWLALLARIAGGGWAGFALTGKPSGAVAGGGIALLLFVIVVWGFVFRDSAIEVGCIAVMILVLTVVSYFATLRIDQKVEESRLKGNSSPRRASTSGAAG
jgi:hypothetical protein